MRQEALESKLIPIADGLGLTCVGIQLSFRGHHKLIRMFVDKQGGVTLGDCEKVSRKVNSLLSVEIPEAADYSLEVSSPGLDRLLFTAEQCRPYIQKTISVRLKHPIKDIKQLKGNLVDVEGESIVMDSEGKTWTFHFGDVLEARLVPVW